MMCDQTMYFCNEDSSVNECYNGWNVVLRSRRLWVRVPLGANMVLLICKGTDVYFNYYCINFLHLENMISDMISDQMMQLRNEVATRTCNH